MIKLAKEFNLAPAISDLVNLFSKSGLSEEQINAQLVGLQARQAALNEMTPEYLYQECKAEALSELKSLMPNLNKIQLRVGYLRQTIMSICGILGEPIPEELIPQAPIGNAVMLTKKTHKP